ncbi:hypothetical protein MKX01_021133 [Papaver californicum]|nr:hypothetical protein MKX01_021133 [Papaver californicum]
MEAKRKIIGNIDKGKVMFRYISCYCIENINTVSLLWMSENGAPWILKNDHSFFWFWEKAKVNDHGCIELLVKVENPELANDNKRSMMNTPKKKTVMSKSPQVRRSPRLTKKKKNASSFTAKKLFGMIVHSLLKQVLFMTT